VTSTERTVAYGRRQPRVARMLVLASAVRASAVLAVLLVILLAGMITPLAIPSELIEAFFD